MAVIWSCGPVVSVSQAEEPRSHGEAAREARLKIDVLQELDMAMEKEVGEKNVSGVIGLIGRKGKVGYYEAFGQRHLEKGTPMDKNSLLRIYSMTKPIVAVTAMSIWEEGKFKLDDPISKYLPEWKDMKVREGDKEVPARRPVTPRQLMTHTTGITYDRRGLKLGPKDSLSDFSKSMASRPLVFHPGERYAYGYSLDILGRYLEAIEGKALDVIMRERVFDKLGMSDTEFWVRKEEDRARVALVYRKNKDGELHQAMGPDAVMKRPPRMMGGQGLISTTGDFARFCEMFLRKGELNGKRVLKPETVDLMLKNHLKDIGKVYGLGGMVNGKGRYEWGGAAGTRFWVDCREGHYVVFMIQNWGRKPGTWDVFKKHAQTALVGE